MTRIFRKATVALAALLLAAPVIAQDIVLDNDGGAPIYTETGNWLQSGTAGYNSGIYRYSQYDFGNTSTATWTTTVPNAGLYEFRSIFLQSANRFANTRYDVTIGSDTTTRFVNQSGSLLLVERTLGKYNVAAGETVSVTLYSPDVSGTHVVISDAIRITPTTDEPPVIVSTLTDVSTITPATPGRLVALVEDDFGVSSVSGEYRVNGSGFTSITMSQEGGNWVGDLPSLNEGDFVEARVSATDTNNATTVGPLISYTVSATAPPEYRALWIDSWNSNSILTQANCDALVAHARANNINTLIVQVRKVGDAAFIGIEPKATNVAAGFDPLARLIQQGHDTSGGKEKVHIHAWFVMHRIATSVSLNPNHILSTNPEYAMQTRDGEIFAGNVRYLDPGHPGVPEHNIAVILDAMQNYNIDGVNLDYIRYPEYAGDWGYNPVSVARYNRANNFAPGNLPTNNASFKQWRRDQVTNEVRKLYIKMKELRPEVVLTTCTVNWGTSYNYDPNTNTGNWLTSSPYNSVYQDWVGWLREGIIDYNAIMNYTPGTDTTRYNGWTNLSLNNDGIRGSIIGIGAYLHTQTQQSINQLLYARNQGAAGINIYDWDSEILANTEGKNKAAFYAEVKAAVIPEWVDPPTPSWIANPTKGILQGTITKGGVQEDWASAVITTQGNRTVRSDGMGWYGHTELNPGTHTIRATAIDGTMAERTFNISAGQVLTLDIELLPPSGVADWSEL